LNDDVGRNIDIAVGYMKNVNNEIIFCCGCLNFAEDI
jgi:hypothetical protein